MHTWLCRWSFYGCLLKSFLPLSSLDVHFGWGSVCWYQGGKSDSVYVTLQFIVLWCGLCVYSVLSVAFWFGKSKMSFSIQRPGRGSTVNGLWRATGWQAKAFSHSLPPSSWDCVLHFGLSFLLTGILGIYFSLVIMCTMCQPQERVYIRQRELLPAIAMNFTQKMLFLLPSCLQICIYPSVTLFPCHILQSITFLIRIQTCAISETCVLQSFSVNSGWHLRMFVTSEALEQ